MAKSDDILKKYGITQVRGSEEKSDKKETEKSRTSSAEAKGTGSNKADGILSKYGITQVRQSNAGSAQEWAKESSSLLSEAQQYFSNWHSKDDDGYSSFHNRIDSYISQGNNLYRLYADDDDASNAISSILSALNSASSNAPRLQTFYSQFDTEDDYNNWQTFEKDHSTVENRQEWYSEQESRLNQLKADRDAENARWSEVDPIMLGAESVEYQTAAYEHTKRLKAIDDEISAIETEIRNYERGNYNEAGQYYGNKTVDDYYNISQRDDFDAVSANRDFDNATKEDFDKWYYQTYGGVMIDPDTGKEIEGSRVNPGVAETSKESLTINDPLGFYLQAKEYRDSGDARYESFGVVSREYDQLMTDASTGSWDELKNTEIGIYYVLLNEQGYDAAMKFLKDMEVELNKRATMNANKNTAAAYDEANLLGKVMLNAASVAASTMSAPWVMMENVVATAKGEEINPYSTTKSGMHFSTTVRNETAEDFNADGGNIPILTDLTGFTKGDAYQAGMSILDSYAAIGIGGKLGGVLLATNAASSEATRLYEQGASMKQIALGSAAAGAAEMVFESLSIEKLITMKDAATVGQAIKNALIQAGVEASEEGFTEIANIITNSIIMGDQSDWAKLVEQYNGDTWQAFLSKVKDVVNASIGGFISGAGSAGGPSVVSAVANYGQQQAQYSNAGKAIMEYDGGVDKLMALANEVSGVSDKSAQKSLQKQTGKVQKNATARQVGKLAETVGTAFTAQNKADIVKSLERKNFSSEQANAIADALIARSTGKQLTEEQTTHLDFAKNSKAVQDAISNIVENEQSTMGQRNQALKDFGNEVAFNQVAKQWSKAQEKKSKVKGNVATQEKTAPESLYEVSAEGKTIDSEGNTINIKGIASIEKGKMVLETDNGTIESSKVAYATKDQALVYEAVASLGGIIDADSANKLVNKFSAADGVSAAVYARGITQAYTYGYYGYSMAEAMGENTVASMLTESQRNMAFAFGRVQRKAAAAKAQENRAKYKQAYEESATPGKKGGVYFRNDSMEVSEIDSYLENAGIELKDVQKVSIETMKNLSEALGIEFYVYESYVKDGKRYYIDEDGVEQEGAPNGWYDTKSGKVYIDLHAGAGGRGTMLFTIAHELTHFIHQWSPEKFTKLADIIFTHSKLKGEVASRVAIKMTKAQSRGKPISYEVAYEEVVADAMESILKSGRVMEMVADVKQQDRGLWQKICDWFKDLVDYMKRVVDAYRGQDPDSYEGKAVASMKGLIMELEAVYADALVDASENYQSFMTMAESTEIRDVASGTLHSYSSLAEAAGFTAVENADGTRSFVRDGAKVTKVTVADIENSPIGAFINYSVEKKDISDEDAVKQKKMFAEICTMACQTNDFAMTMQFVGSAVFTGMKANADKQYGTTYDFPSICTKTQAVIDAMSAKMVKLGRGLNSDEIVKLYRDVFASGNPVPCPECYVFSRWIGIGGLLDNIKKYQDFYGNMEVEEVAAAYLRMRDKVAKLAEEQGITFGKAKGALTSKITKEFNKLTEKIEKAQNQGEKVKPADLKRLEELEPMMNTVKGMTWLENVYFADSSLKKVNPRFRVPDDVLFDLNNGEVFASKYKEAWAFRTTQGAGYGKAITPYAEARLGEGILVTNNTTKTIKGKAQETLDNYFLAQKGKLDKQARAALDRARLKQKIQAFIGGQRFQSTSDARFENASDYLLAALEMQAMGGMVQVYTKVDGAVPAFSAWGFSINQSLMPLGGGLDADGNVKDTSVGGMNPRVAFENRKKHETAGTITIGVNDNHIREMFKQWVRDFIIPYHASGGKAEVVAELRRIQEGDEKKGKMVRSTDYSRTQSDKVLSDEVLRWQGKTAEEIQRIHQVRDARIAILTGGSPNMAVVRSNRFLSALYDKLAKGGEWEGVKLAKSKVESQIFPNEFWDQTVSYEDSGKITRDYLEYCNDLGFLHRFSGTVPSNGKLVPVNGYDQNGQRVQLTDLAYKYENGQKTDQVEEFFWKVLTDRRMYDNEGNYLPQKVVTLNDTTTDKVTGFAKNNFGRQYNKEVSMETAKKVANIHYSERESLEDAADAMEKIGDAEYLEAIKEHPFIIVMDHTPEVVLKAMEGEPKAANRRVLIRRDALYLAIRESGIQEGHYHGLGAEVLKKLPEYLENPDVILKTDNSSARRMVLTSIPTKSGQAIISVEFESIKDFEGGYEYFNVIVTVFDLHKNYLKGLFKKRSAEIKYEKEDLAQVNPQLYEWLRIFNAKSSDGMVTQPVPVVKRSDRELADAIRGIEADVHTDDAAAIAEQVTDVMNTAKFSDRDQVHRDETYSVIGKELLAYEEGDMAPDLTLVEMVNERTGKTETTIKHFGQKPKGYVPKRIAYCYKLFEQHPDGSLHALFAGARSATPIGVWQYAQGFPYTDEGVKGMNLRERYGWHLSAGLPSAPHLMSTKDFNRGYPSKNAYGHPKGSKRVWVRMAYDASTDFNTIADSTKEGDIFGLIPFGGYYAFKENNQSEWVISSAVKIDKILTEDERQQILRDAGYDEYEAWRRRHRATDAEKAENKRKSAENKKAKDKAIKAGLNYLSESSRAMRESIQSRIIDNPERKYSDRDDAPIFYSQMAKVVDGVKQDKLGAASVVNMLRGKGVKAEEIKWSGIETWLEGKKSVTKAELQEFIAGSMLQIGEQTSGTSVFVDEDGNTYTEKEFRSRAYELADEQGISHDRVKFTFDSGEMYAYVGNVFSGEILSATGVNGARWSKYKLDGGENYREIVFTLPNSTYSNQMMRVHWGEDAEGVLAHARVQDFNINGKKMLFIEEIQSDYHNEGHESGYADSKLEAEIDRLKAIADERFFAMEDYSTETTGMAGEWEAMERTVKGSRLLLEYMEARDAFDKAMNEYVKKIPDAPFRDTYHEYVLKRLIRMAAEEGYDSIGWTPAEIQVDRWSDEFAEGYRIEYDQDIPKFLRKYGKQWGAEVGKTEIQTKQLSLEQEIDIIYMADILEDPDIYIRGEKGIKEVWTMSITDSMKDSVLTEGQPLYQDREEESVSNRSLLANAFEGLAQNEIERNKIQEYKDNISLVNAEERKLRELNEKIKDLSFAKGPKDTKAIRDLQFEARQTANRISTYDKILLRLEASKPLQDVLNREKEMVRKREKQKGKDALEAYREKTMKTQRELLEKWQESRKKGIDSRNRTAMRHKIKDIVNELNQYLLRGTKDRHVPIELQKAVAEALDAVNMDTVGAEERIAKLQDELLKAKTPEKIQEISRKIDHVREMGDKMNGRLQKLKDAYDQFVNSDDPMIAYSHDEVISNKLQSVIDSIGNTPLRDMNLAQLEDVYDMYRMVLTTIRNANKAFKAKKSESISTIANRVMEEVEQVGGKKKLTMKGMDGIKSFVWNNLKPVYAFEHIGSDTFTDVFNAVRAGEDVWAVDVTEAREFYLDKSKKHGYSSWDFKKRYSFKSTSGMDFSLDLEQIMSLYAYSKRDQAADHLKKGGIVIDETTEITIKNKLGIPVKFNPTEATAYNISEPTLAEIISKLTDEQKAFVDEMQDYLSTVMGAKGNEVSLEMYGIKLFKEKFYFPLKSAHQFMAKAKEQQKGEVKIKNSGFSKETVQKASNPIVLTPFMNVWSDHVNEMSMYHAFVLPMEDFYRVYNYKTPTSETMATESVEMFIQNAYGKGATKYIDQLLKDLNGGARTDSTTGFINKMMGLFKKGSVFASLSVVVQQPSAMARATALVDTKYFIGPKVDHKRHKALWEEVKRYAPVAIIKEMGYFDTNMGKSTQDFILGKEYSGFKEKMEALVTDSNYRDEALSKAPALADEIAWCSIWEAVKRETKAKYPGLDVKGEPFLKLAGSRFTEVIVKTQVYDSVLSRSGMMRSKDTGMKMATAFMAEPTTSINMIADALLQGKRGNWKYARTAIGAVIASQILNSILVSFVYAGRDDDEDETYVEKYIGTLTGEILDSLNPAGYIPFIKDIQSIVKGYDVERSDMAVVSDLWNAIQNLKKDNVSVYRKVEGFAGSIAQIFGLPVKNIMRDARGIYQTIMSFVNGQQTTGAGIGYAVKGAITRQEVSDKQQLYEAMLRGDKAHIARVKGGFKDQSAINSAIRKALRENDPRIREAAIAWNASDLDEYMRIAKAIIAEKHFVQDDVVMAIRSEAEKLSPDAETATTSKAKGMFTAEKFAEAIAQGDQAMANAIKVDIIQTAEKNGKSAEDAEKSFASSAKSELKEMFQAGTISEQAVINALATYCDIDQESAIADVQYWAFKQDYPDVYADDAWFDKYYEEVADSGIEIDVYMDYRNKVKDITGDGKKERRMAIIHALPITSAQKDALYYAEGWAASKLNEAPWH